MSFAALDYPPKQVTTDQYVIASVVLGFTLGFVWLTSRAAIRHTWHVYKEHGVVRSPYVWMVWGQILTCVGSAILYFLYLRSIVVPSLVPPPFPGTLPVLICEVADMSLERSIAFYFCIFTLWALQVQFLLQIIVSRCSILMHTQRALQLTISVAVFITLVQLVAYAIWIPANLRISEHYIWISTWWDRCEKCLYFLTDAALNIYFIVLVQRERQLVASEIATHKPLVRFNIFIIGLSLSMDLLIICLMNSKTMVVSGERSDASRNRGLSLVRKTVESTLQRTRTGSSRDSACWTTELPSGDPRPQQAPRAIIYPRHYSGGGGDGNGGQERVGIHTSREFRVEYEANPMYAVAPWTDPASDWLVS
ncbi:CFEM domain-containing protein [Apiospora arundinis]